MIRGIVLGLVVLMHAGVVMAQDTLTQTSSIGGGASSQMSDSNFALTAMIRPVENQPYQAEKSSRSVQKLADGTVITVEMHGLVARSSAGQVREDIHSNISGMVSGRMLDKNTTMASVADPSAHTITMWQTAEEKSALKTAMVMHLPALPKGMGGVMGGGVVGGGSAVRLLFSRGHRLA